MRTRCVCKGLGLNVIAFLLLSGVLVSLCGIQAAAQDADRWQIVRADYGFGMQRVDVTRIVSDLVAHGGVNGRIAVNNQTMGGDPAVGRDKALRIFARNRTNQQQEFHVNEGDSFAARSFMISNDHNAPAPMDNHSRNSFQDIRDENNHDEHYQVADQDDHDRGRDDHDRDHMNRLMIVKAFYGVQGRSANVTDRLQGMVRDGRITVLVNNGSMGGDPAIGGDKVLIVVYAIDGQEQATAVREGFILSIP